MPISRYRHILSGFDAIESAEELNKELKKGRSAPKRCPARNQYDPGVYPGSRASERRGHYRQARLLSHVRQKRKARREP